MPALPQKKPTGGLLAKQRAAAAPPPPLGPPARDVCFVRGMLLRVRDSVVAPFEQRPGGWACVVVAGKDKVYRPGSTHVFITDADLMAATRVRLQLPEDMQDGRA